jgi:hypothetical protein
MAPGASQTPTQHDHNDDHDDAKLFSRSHDDAAGAVASRPGSPTAPPSATTTPSVPTTPTTPTSSARARSGAAAPSARPGAPCRSWKSDDARPANEAGDDDEDADTEPTDDDEQQLQLQQQHLPKSAKQSPPAFGPTPAAAVATTLRPRAATRESGGGSSSRESGSSSRHERAFESPKALTVRSFGSAIHPIRGLSFPSSTSSTITLPVGVVDVKGPCYWSGRSRGGSNL